MEEVREVNVSGVGFALAVSLSTALTGCNFITGPASDVRVVTSSSTYARQDSDTATVAFSVTNLAGQTVHVRRCGWIAVEVLRRQVSTWTRVRGGYCTADRDWSPIELPPGATESGEVRLTDVGDYRLRISLTNRRSTTTR